MNTVDASGARQLIDEPTPGLVVLDIRTPEEWAGGRLPGSVMLDFFDDDFLERVGALDRSVPYLVYCRSGARSAKAVELMGQLGFPDLTDFTGGWLEWADSGFPAEP